MTITTSAVFDTSKSLPTIDAGWIRWIDENLGRGCTLQGMVAEMVKRGFNPIQARQAIERRGVLSVSEDFSWMQQPSIKTNDREIQIVSHRDEPKIAVLDGVMSVEECAELIRRSANRMKPSTTVDKQTGEYKVIRERSSESTYHTNTDEFIRRLNRRFSEIMQAPISHGEDIQVVRYRPGGEYKAHWDYFPPTDPGSKTQMVSGGQRISTLILYLNTVESGGATGFPDLNFKVQPKTGQGLYFHYTDRRGKVDSRTLHAGEPVVAGEKWIATRWMRQTPRI